MMTSTNTLLRRCLASLLVVSFALAAPVSLAETPDPWEGLNRRFHASNSFFDRILLRPIARGYTKVVPRFARQGITNLFRNLGTPGVAVNQLLQGKPRLFLSDTGRFLVNSTLGIGGLFDPATGAGLPAHQEDFGQTFRTWGIPTGRYLVLPLLGSSTVTDGVGSILDAFTNPVRYHETLIVRYSIYGLNILDLRANLLGAGTLVSGDEYLFFRDAYLQRREFLQYDGQLESDPFLDDDFDDFDDEFDEEVEAAPQDLQQTLNEDQYQAQAY